MICAKRRYTNYFKQEFARLGDALEVRLSFREEMKIHIKEEYYGDAMKLFRKRQNFLNHADKDSDGQIDDLQTRELAFVILFAGKNFMLLEQRLTPALSVFLHWFGAAEPKLLKKPNTPAEDNYLKNVEELRRNFADLYSAEAFKFMRMLLQEHYQPK
jgi:hypothetical protein